MVLTKRAVLMEAQVDVLDGKRKAMARHRADLASLADRLEGVTDLPEPPTPSEALSARGRRPRGQPRVDPRYDRGVAADDALPAADDALPPSLSRVVLSAQEDLRREIARSMHDGPGAVPDQHRAPGADRGAPDGAGPGGMAKGELRLLVSMVQQTLDATKNFIFDVRPMVLDDLGLVPTLRRATRERGAARPGPRGVRVAGSGSPAADGRGERRLPDPGPGLAAYLALGPERVQLRLDWGDELEARLSAHRTPVAASTSRCPRSQRRTFPTRSGA